MNNQAIRQAAKASGIRLWEVAEAIGINDGNLSRKLRHELSPEEQERILEAISKLAEEGKR